MGKEINWAKNLEDISAVKEKRPEGDGWFTVSEFIDNASIGSQRAYQLIRVGIADGKVEKFIGSVYSNEHQHRVKRVWYRFISGK